MAWERLQLSEHVFSNLENNKIIPCTLKLFTLRLQWTHIIICCTKLNGENLICKKRGFDQLYQKPGSSAMITFCKIYNYLRLLPCRIYYKGIMPVETRVTFIQLGCYYSRTCFSCSVIISTGYGFGESSLYKSPFTYPTNLTE